MFISTLSFLSLTLASTALPIIQSKRQFSNGIDGFPNNDFFKNGFGSSPPGMYQNSSPFYGNQQNFSNRNQNPYAGLVNGLFLQRNEPIAPVNVVASNAADTKIVTNNVAETPTEAVKPPKVQANQISGDPRMNRHSFRLKDYTN